MRNARDEENATVLSASKAFSDPDDHLRELVLLPFHHVSHVNERVRDSGKMGR